MSKPAPESRSSGTDPGAANAAASTPVPSTLVFDLNAAAFSGIISSDVLIVPGYEILTEVGRGGMGVVYKARQLNLNRLVALKMIRDGVLANANQRSRFRKEAESVARLKHANIVQIYDIGELNGRPFLSLEFIDGCSLKDKIAGQPQPVQLAAQLVETLARAMHHVHDQGLVHRDLKPGNILMQAHGAPAVGFGTPRISDFGLAKDIGDETSLTPTGCPIGTANYMPPEQAQGDKSIGPPADVYGLGAILYEMLTGQPPFIGDTWMEIAQKVVYQNPAPPSQLRADLQRDLELICLKCLEKEPAKRYPTAEALAADLHAFLRCQPIDAQTSVDELEKRLVSIVNPLKPSHHGKPELPWAEEAGYEILAPLPNVSRMAAYQARHRASGQAVALRVLMPSPVNPLQKIAWEYRRAELQHEADILAQLEHPSIPRFFARGESNGYHFLALHYVDGLPLHHYLANRRPDPQEAARIGETLARTLHYAHGLGIVHSDLRPNNILVHETGQVWLTNFGVVPRDANDVTTSQTLTRLRYLAPEQAFSENNESTPASNIYTLGTLIYELVAGHPPFEFKGKSLWKGLELLLKQTPLPPSQLGYAVPEPLDAICLRCLQKEPADRFPNAFTLAAALAQFRAAAP